MKKVVGLGAKVLDTLISCPTFPTEDTKSRADAIKLSGGGPVGNAMVVMAKLGTRAEIIGSFADDNAGRYLIDDYKRYGVETKNAVILEGESSFTSYIILSKESSSRTCLYDRGSVADEPDRIVLSALDDADILHLDGNYLKSAIHAAKYAKAHGVKVSLDAGGAYPGIEELLPLVDILIPSAEFAAKITGIDDPAKSILKLNELYSPEVLVVTDGVRGGYYLEDGKACHYNSVKTDVVDTNGAGDTFHGAFVSAYAEGESVEFSCRFASAVAAYKCAHVGARDYMLTRKIAMELTEK